MNTKTQTVPATAEQIAAFAAKHGRLVAAPVPTEEDPMAELARLREENARLLANRNNGPAKGTPSIKDGLVKFAKITGFAGLSLNPSAFRALRANFAEACRLYDAIGDAAMEQAYLARPVFVSKK